MNEDPTISGEHATFVREILFLGRQWRLVAVCVAVCLAAAGAFDAFARPLYTAQAVVSFEFEGADARVRYVDPTRRAESVAREAVVLGSRDLAEMAVSARPAGLVSELALSAPSGAVGRVVTELRHRIGLERQLDPSHMALVQRFLQRLTVASDPPSTWVTLSFVGYEPAVTAAALNALVDAYVEYSQKETAAVDSEVRARAESRVQSQSAALGAAVRALNAGTESGRDPVAQQALAQKMLATLQDRLVAASADVVAKRARYASLSQIDEAALADVARREQDPAFLAAEARIEAAQARLRALDPALGEQHPDMISTRAEIAEASRVRAQRLESFRTGAREALDQAVRSEASLRTAIVGAERTAALSESAIVDQAAARERAASDQRRLAETVARAQDELPVLDLKIIQRAEPPFMPSSPQVVPNLTFALLFGLGGGLAVAAIRERVARKVLDAVDVKATGATLLGLIPTVADPVTLLRQDLEEPTSALSEAYRKVQTYLEQRMPKDGGRVLLFSSASAGDGKTTTVASLAMLMARKGFRVLLIDADLRRPALTRYFGPRTEGGLSAAVAARSLDPFAATVAPNLDLLATDEVSEHAPEVLGSSAFASLLEYARRRYDYVLCDAPPLLPVADALIILPLVEGIVLVAASGRTPLQALWDAIEHVRLREGHLIGVVLNRVDFRGAQYGYYGQYAYRKAPRKSSSAQASSTEIRRID